MGINPWQVEVKLIIESASQFQVHLQALATRKIVTRRDASIEKINKIWAVHFRP